MNRRLFLKSVAYCSVSFLATPQKSKASSAKNTSIPSKQTQTAKYISAIKRSNGEFGLALLDSNGSIIETAFNNVDLPTRGHSFSYNHVSKHIFAIARRPGNYILVFDHSGLLVKTIHSENGRHFYGHAVTDKKGEFLYTTENNFQDGVGVIGIYSVRNNYDRIAEYSSYGIGPHDIKLSHDNSALVIANGGLKTHPERGRKKLNLESMKPSLVYIDKKSGKLLHTLSLSETERFNSIRHFDISTTGTVFMALQNQKTNTKPTLQQTKLTQNLISIYNAKNNTYARCKIPRSIEETLSGYIGDICLDSSEQYFIASAPRGSALLVFTYSGKFIRSIHIDDVCGISKTMNEAEFIISSGLGKTFMLSLNKTEPQTSPSFILEETFYSSETRFDNHLTMIF